MLYRRRHAKVYGVTLVLLASLQCFFTAGIFYGWPSIKDVYKRVGFFHDLCGNTTSTSCYAQESRFSLVFTAASVTCCVMSLPIGIMIDSFGPKLVQYLGLLTYAAACCGLIFVDKAYENWLFVVYVLVAMGSSFLVNSLYAVVNIALVETRGRFQCILSGIYDASSVNLLLVKLMYDHGVKLQLVMIGYGTISVAVVFAFIALCVPSRERIHAWISENNFDIDYRPLTSTEEEQEELEPTINLPNQRGRDSIMVSLKSSLYLIQAFSLIVIQCKLVYFEGDLNDVLSRITSGETEKSRYINLFSTIQFCGIVVTPVVAVMFDATLIFGGRGHDDRSPHEAYVERFQEIIVVMVAVWFFATAFSVLSLFTYLSIQIPLYILYVITRAFVFSFSIAFIGRVFPAEHFGRLVGCATFAAGVCSFSQYFFFWLTNRVFDGNTLWSDVILLVFVCATIIQPVNCYRCYKNMKRSLKKM